MREKVVAAKDTSLSTSSRTSLNADFQEPAQEHDAGDQQRHFDGANILNGSQTSAITFLADADAATVITMNLQNLSLSGTINTLTATDSINTMTNASGVLARLDATFSAVNQAVGSIGSQAKQIEAHNTFVSKLNDVLETGVGNLVDADMAKESARLQALQVSSSSARRRCRSPTRAPQIILSLFSGGS